MVDENAGDVVLTNEEAQARGIAARPRPDPTLVNSRPCVWMERRKKRVMDGKQLILEDLGFGADGEDEDDIAEDDEEEEDERPSRRRTHPFLDNMCAVDREDRRKRRREEWFDSD